MAQHAGSIKMQTSILKYILGYAVLDLGRVLTDLIAPEPPFMLALNGSDRNRKRGWSKAN